MTTFSLDRLPLSLPSSPSDPSDGRFLSQAECAALAKRVSGMAVGGGWTQIMLNSTWRGATSWARNRLKLAEDNRDNAVQLIRNIRGADPYPRVESNQTDDAALEAAVRRAERLLQFHPETQKDAFMTEYTEQHLKPTIWSEATYTLEGEARAEIARTLIQSAEQAGLVAAGDIEVSATGRAVMSSRGRAMYYPYTGVHCSMTVRDPKAQGSGWAGVSHWDWTKVDAPALAARALEKCLASRNPVAVEPGRYTTILEPQAVADLCGGFFGGDSLGTISREEAEMDGHVFNKVLYQSRLGEVVMDERLTISMDPMDPELGQPPFRYNRNGNWLEVYYPAVWIKNGVLTNLAYQREYAVAMLGKNTGLPTLGAMRMRGSGTPTSIDEMIATTKRGVLVTRLEGGYTRDGTWLIENNKISKPIKNFKFSESFYHILQPSRLEQIGAPVRVFSKWGYDPAPQLVPSLKVKDFNFTQLIDAI